MVKKLEFWPLNRLYHHLYLSDIAIALLGLFIFSCLLQKLTNKGPMLWPIFGITPIFIFHRTNLFDWTTRTLTRANGTFSYRGIWFGGAYGLVTIDPSKIEHMLKTSFKNFPKGKHYRERFQDLLGDGIFNADGEWWKEQRRITTSEMNKLQFMEFAFKNVEDLVHVKLLKVVEKVVKLGEPIDLQEVLLRFTFDNICNVAFGVDSGCLNSDLPEIPFANAFEIATELTLFRFIVPPLVWKPMKYFNLGFESRLKEAIEVVHGFVEKIVEDRKMQIKLITAQATLGNNDQFDLLSRLIEIENQHKLQDRTNTSSKLSNNFLRDFCISFILAGRDTSSVGLAWFFWLIHENPKVETKIVREIQEILLKRQSYRKEEEEETVFSTNELQKMVYLQAALSESLRLYPPVPFDFKEALENDEFHDGTFVKKGARIMYSIFAMGRMESIWGKDCLEFKPERWIKGGKFDNENQFKYVIFNGGPRLCPGKKFAFLQMKMVVASLLVRYSVKVVEGQNVVPKMTTTLYMKNGMFVTFEPRTGL